MPDASAGLWEKVRRALGRLAASARVRELSPLGLAPPPRISVSDDLTSAAPTRGVGERLWQPQAEVSASPRLMADAGGGGADMAAVVSMVGLDAAIDPGSITILASPEPPSACTVHLLRGIDTRSWRPVLQTAPVAPTAGVIRDAVRLLTIPNTASLPVGGPSLAREQRALPFGKRRPPDDPLRLAGGGIRQGTAEIAQVPLMRARRPAPPGTLIGEAFADERRRLAQGADAALDDVVLLGVFPQVPVAAVRRLALEEGGGALSLWLKPEALAAAVAGKSPRLATLIIGRRRSTGKMIQTVA